MTKTFAILVFAALKSKVAVKFYRIEINENGLVVMNEYIHALAVAVHDIVLFEEIKNILREFCGFLKLFFVL